eukprot:12608252-Prorocentrum_lima.AAC.1
MELTVFPTLTNNVTSNIASSSNIPIAAGMEGVAKKPCARFMTDRTRLFIVGGKCRYEHPQDCPV